MNDFEQSENREIMIDRLVDDELSESERRELLLSFEREPAAWRQCALAFLEARSWRSEMTELVAKPALRQELERSTYVDRSSWNQALGRFFSLAAVALITVGVTLLVRDRIAGSAPGEPADQSVALQTPQTPDKASPGMKRPTEQRPVIADEALTLVVEGAADAPLRTLRVPLVERDNFAGDMDAAPNGPAIPEGVRRLLERLGHRVENRRRYAAIELEDGSRVLLPVDDVHIYPVPQHVQ